MHLEKVSDQCMLVHCFRQTTYMGFTCLGSDTSRTTKLQKDSFPPQADISLKKKTGGTHVLNYVPIIYSDVSLNACKRLRHNIIIFLLINVIIQIV